MPFFIMVHIVSSLAGYMLSISVVLVEWRLFFDTDAKTVGYVGVILGFLGPTMGESFKYHWSDIQHYSISCSHAWGDLWDAN